MTINKKPISTIISAKFYDVACLEDYVKSLMGYELAHDYEHASRTRNWALKIASLENPEIAHLVEPAALMHDIGLSVQIDRHKHGLYGAKLARNYLHKNTSLTSLDISLIADAIENHNNLNSISAPSDVLKIVVDADTLELLGVTGILRAVSSNGRKPIYDERNIKGDTWGMTATDLDKYYSGKLSGSLTIIDQLNMHLSCVDVLNTPSAKKFAEPLITYMKNFIELLEMEVSQNGLASSK